MSDLPDWARRLDFSPHPEGGWFRETWRSELTIPQSALPPDYAGSRNAGTAILFLLMPGQQSAWHTVRSAELWLYHSRRAPAAGDRPDPGQCDHPSAGSRHHGRGDTPSSSSLPGTGSGPARAMTSPAWSAAWSCRDSTSPTSRSALLPAEQFDGGRHQRGVARRGGPVGQRQRVLHPDAGLHSPHTRVFQ